MKPSRKGDFEGQCWTEAGERWRWTFVGSGKFTVSIEQSYPPPSEHIGHFWVDITHGLDRRDAAQMAGLLLMSPLCNAVRLAEDKILDWVPE